MQTLEKTNYTAIKETLSNLYSHDERPWLVGFSGGKDISEEELRLV